MSRITTFYSDKEKTNALYPITKTNAIYDNNNVNLEQRLNEALKLQMDLLWTNASPKSAFASQTINVNLSNYKQIAITYNIYGSGIIRFKTSIITIGDNHILNGTGSNGGTASTFTGTPYNVLRSVTAITSKISFGSGYIEFINSTSISQDNNAVIPRKIYGIK